MTHASLAAHYRPQTFAEVTGQQMITTVLSRACAEEKVAPAYLLSGTRGVGKTTIARIFAKALNCVQAPTGEPCNNCEQCHKVTQGNHVDVTEIDGASNNSVDDARALREHIGYAAMEGRYKVFIIDEAHMLSRNAFNALLKTLEEPPARVVFIFATTEVHKFPITIISRCQHFVFKRLVEDELIDHLNKVLAKENVQYDQGAVSLIARRAAGSVRDGMSLLGQSLALGEKVLSLENTRQVLGLAGQEFFEALMQGIVDNDCQRIVELSNQLGDQGVDIGFFLRELTSLWRTLFLIREAGANILPSLSLSFDEAKHWCEVAPKFSTAHLHAAWHMTLDAQRKIIHSPEPAAALELLLLNLTLMPRLLPLHKLDDVGEGSTGSGSQGTSGGSSPSTISTASVDKTKAQDSNMLKQNQAVQAQSSELIQPELENINLSQANATQVEAVQINPAELELAPVDLNANDTSASHKLEASIIAADTHTTNEAQQSEHIEQYSEEPMRFTESANILPIVQGDIVNSVSSVIPSWETFCDYLQAAGQKHGQELVPTHILSQARGIFSEKNLEISTMSNTCCDRLNKVHAELERLCSQYCGFDVGIVINEPIQNHKAESVLKQEFKQREDMQNCLNILDAVILHVSPAHK